MASKPKAKRKRGPGRPRKVWLEDYASVGQPPADPLEMPGYAMKLLGVAMDKLRTDPKINERERLRELRSCARAIVPLIPRARLRRAEKTVLDAMERREAPLNPKLVELVDAAPVDRRGLATTYRRVRERER